MNSESSRLQDTGERMIPTQDGEISIVYARHRFAYDYAAQFIADRRVLDIGCGTGYGCKMLAEKAGAVVGIDHDKNAIEYCREHYGADNIEYLCMDANEIDLKQTFDVAVTFQVIEHMKDLDKFLNQLKNVVEDGGHIIITTPNVKTPMPGKEQNPFHFNEMNYPEFKTVLSRHFDEFRILGVGYAAENKLRKIIARSPLYRLGRLLKRGSRLKKVAAKAMDLTSFRIVEQNVSEEAADLLGVCTNNKESG